METGIDDDGDKVSIKDTVDQNHLVILVKLEILMCYQLY